MLLINDKTNFRAMALVIVLGALAAGYVQWEASKPLPAVTPLQLETLPSNMAWVTLDFGDGTRRSFRGEVIENLSPLMALEFSAEVGNIPFAMSTSAKSKMEEIAYVDGKPVTDTKGWVFYVNGGEGKDPATYRVQPTDEILWKYE